MEIKLSGHHRDGNAVVDRGSEIGEPSLIFGESISNELVPVTFIKFDRGAGSSKEEFWLNLSDLKKLATLYGD